MFQEILPIPSTGAVGPVVGITACSSDAWQSLVTGLGVGLRPEAGTGVRSAKVAATNNVAETAMHMCLPSELTRKWTGTRPPIRQLVGIANEGQ